VAVHLWVFAVSISKHWETDSLLDALAVVSQCKLWCLAEGFANGD